MKEENFPGISAPGILTAGAKHMSDRAALRDSPSGERSMKRCVEAFNALEGTALTETQGWRFMAVLKHARATQGSLSMDDYEDWAAYAALAGESAAREPTAGGPTTEEGIKSDIAALSSLKPVSKQETFTTIQQESKDEPTAARCPAPMPPDVTTLPDMPPGVFSPPDLPMIGQDYYYRSNTGEVSVRRWQSTPQEWKRLGAGHVFKTYDACKTAGYIGPYIFHEDDPTSYPTSYPESGKVFWYVEVNPISAEWQVFSFTVDGEKSLNLAQAFHRRGLAASCKERAEAKAFWRNLSMQRHGTPFGPLHPDAEQSTEAFPGSDDEGEEHV